MADAKNRKIEKSLREEQAAATSARGCVQVGGGAMSGDVERLELRLKQLALEYKAVVERLAKKTRQNSILKRAVLESKSTIASLESRLDESSKQEEVLRAQNEDVGRRLKDKTRALQEHAQRMDGLEFRNRNLKKRVTKLKQMVGELRKAPRAPAAQSASRGGWGAIPILGGILSGGSNAGSTPPTGGDARRSQAAGNASNGGSAASMDHKLRVLEEDLTAKIRENSKLHMAAAERQETHSRELGEARAELERTRQELTRADKARRESDARSSELAAEAAALRQSTAELDAKWRRAQRERGDSEQQTKNATLKLAERARVLEARFALHVTFDDSKIGSLTGLSLPLFDRADLAEKRAVVDMLATATRSLHLRLVTLLRSLASVVGARVGIGGKEAAAALHARVMRLIPNLDGSFSALTRALESAQQGVAAAARGGTTVGTEKDSASSGPGVLKAASSAARVCATAVNAMRWGLSDTDRELTGQDLPLDEPKQQLWRTLRELEQAVESCARSLTWTYGLVKFAEGRAGLGEESSGDDTTSAATHSRQRTYSAVLSSRRVSNALAWLKPGNPAYETLILLATASGISEPGITHQGTAEAFTFASFQSLLSRASNLLVKRHETVAKEAAAIAELMAQFASAVERFEQRCGVRGESQSANRAGTAVSGEIKGVLRDTDAWMGLYSGAEKSRSYLAAINRKPKSVTVAVESPTLQVSVCNPAVAADSPAPLHSPEPKQHDAAATDIVKDSALANSEPSTEGAARGDAAKGYRAKIDTTVAKDPAVAILDSSAWAALQEQKVEMSRLVFERNAADDRAVELHLLLERAATRLFKVQADWRAAEKKAKEAEGRAENLEEDLRLSKEKYEKMIHDLTVHMGNLVERIAKKDAMLS